MVVVFDLGNVVLNWDVDRILDSLNLDAHDTHNLRTELFQHQDWLSLDHGIVSEPLVISKVCGRSSLSRKTVEGALLAAKNSLTLIDETINLMNEISSKGIKMYCLSNMSRETYKHIERHDFFQMFSGILISGVERRMKPNKEIFSLLLDRFDLTPGNTLFIDDSIDNIESAKRLGILGFHFKGENSCYSGIRELLF
jgi:putative hydrolase of the HAD superfamily